MNILQNRITDRKESWRLYPSFGRRMICLLTRKKCLSPLSEEVTHLLPECHKTTYRLIAIDYFERVSLNHVRTAQHLFDNRRQMIRKREYVDVCRPFINLDHSLWFGGFFEETSRCGRF